MKHLTRTGNRSHLLRDLVNTFGSSILLLAIEDESDVTDGAFARLTSIQGPILVYSPASSGQYTLGTFQGRPAMVDAAASGHQKSLRGILGGQAKSVWRASFQVSRTGFGAINLLTTSTVNAGLVKATGNAASWLANGWTHYANGVQTSAISYGIPALYEADLASSAATGVSLGGYYDDYAPRDACPDASTFAMVLNGVPTAEQRAFGTRSIQHFLGIF